MLADIAPYDFYFHLQIATNLCFESCMEVRIQVAITLCQAAGPERLL